MPRKLTDEDVARLREQWDGGVGVVDLAAEFGVSQRHVRRLVKGEQQPAMPAVAGLDREQLATGSVASAVETLLRRLDLDEGGDALAAIALAVACKLDAAGASDSAGAAQAVPRLASELVDVLARLRDGAKREPDRLDQLRQRREARLLTAAASRDTAGASQAETEAAPSNGRAAKPPPPARAPVPKRKRRNPPGNTARNGYGAAHKRLRATWSPRVAAGSVDCARCGERIEPGQDWDLGHDDHDRSKYSGPEHASCNRATAGRRPAKRPSRRPAKRPSSRDW